MTTKVELFGTIKLVKKNPWYGGKLLSLTKAGLAKPKKSWILSDPPPWFGDPSKLSPAQLYQVMRFAEAAHEIRGKGTIKERIINIKAKAGGKTNLAKEKPKIFMPKIKKIISIAMAEGVEIPAGLRQVLSSIQAMPVAPQGRTPMQVAVIQE